MQALLTEEDERIDNPIEQYPLVALILCPTRELVMQVSMEFAKLIDATTLDGDGDGDGETSQSLIKCLLVLLGVFGVW